MFEEPVKIWSDFLCKSSIANSSNDDFYFTNYFIHQVITLDIEGRKASIDSLNETVEERRRDSSVQKYHDKLAKINRAFAEVQFKAGRRKDDIVTVYQKIVVQFEEWLVKIRKRLDSGELLSTDILQFEENLTVSNLISTCIPFFL